MKKLFLMVVLSITLVSSALSISALEQSTLPEYTDKLVEGTYKIIESSDDAIIIVINGITYIYKLK